MFNKFVCVLCFVGPMKTNVLFHHFALQKCFDLGTDVSLKIFNIDMRISLYIPINLGYF